MDWLLVAGLLLLVWFEIWVEPISQSGMPGAGRRRHPLRDPHLQG
jgi:hypothetical protein